VNEEALAHWGLSFQKQTKTVARNDYIELPTAQTMKNLLY